MQNPLSSLTHRERFGLAVLASALVLFGIGSFFFRSTAAPLEPTLIKTGTLRPSPASTASTPSPHPSVPPELVVYVTGAVRSPGIYTFSPGARLYHAIGKAGGFKKDAQREALNLAGFLKDTDHLHVPAQGAAALPSLATSRALPPATIPPPHSSGKLHSPGEGKVHLNTATLQELQKLPGIGPSMAQRILDYRQANGVFQELVQLKEVRGIGEKTFVKLEPFLAL